MTAPRLPVAIVGAGPVGLAAAAHLLARGLEPLVLEAGPQVGAAVRALGPCADVLALALRHRRRRPCPAGGRGLVGARGRAYPTGAELVERYLAPLAATAALRGRIRTGARVTGVARRDHGRLQDGQARDAAPFVLHVATADGGIEAIEAAAVIDCGGTWQAPNPAGAHGMPAPGEAAQAGRIAYGIPDVLAHGARGLCRRATTLVVGAGHSAMNAVLDLAELATDRARHARSSGPSAGRWGR